MANIKMPEDRQQHFIHFRVTQEEYEKLKASGETFGTSPNLYVKDLALKSKLREPYFDFDTTTEFRTELARQGNNLNQLTSAVNRLAKNNNDPDITNAFRYTYKMLRTAQEAWRKLWQQLQV